MIETLIIITAVIGFIIAAYHDLFRECEVPDYLTGALILIGIAMNLVLVIQSLDLTRLLTIAIIVPATFTGAYALYKAKQWGGGDVKMLTAAAALFPNPQFMLFFIINLLVCGAAWGIINVIYLGVKKRNLIKEQILKQAKETRILKLAVPAVIAITILSLFYEPSLGTITILFLLGGLTSIMLIANVVEKTSFYKKLNINKVLEGDWIAENIDKLGLKKNQQLSKKNINELRNAGITEILIKWGVPFIPAFLAALILTLALNDKTISFYLGTLRNIIQF